MPQPLNKIVADVILASVRPGPYEWSHMEHLDVCPRCGDGGCTIATQYGGRIVRGGHETSMVCTTCWGTHVLVYRGPLVRLVGVRPA